MGDCGSLFIGFVIATMSVLVPSYQGGVRSVVGTALFAFVPAVDTSVVVISRRRAGRPLLLGGTDHVAHRLRRLGLSVGQVGLALLAASGGVSFAGVLVTCRTLPAVPTLVAVILAALISVAVMLRIPAYEQGTAQDHTIPVPKLTRHAPHTDLSSANAFASLPIHSGTRPPQPETVEHREPA
jgi:UDP-GlcNAc:undecaprenyl-phosphate GlcNAc-1-phosphate transferase